LKKVVAVMGGIAIDLEAKPYKKLLMEESNPGRLEITCGGVGRNIAENLQRMGGMNVFFFSAVGEDIYAEKALQSIASIGVNTECVCRISKAHTATYLSILDETGNMALAVAAMDIFDRILPDMAKEATDSFCKADFIVLDANLSEEMLVYVAEKFKNKRIFLDPVSIEKAKKVRGILNRCHTIKPNKAEAEILSGIKINNDKDLEAASEILIKKGIKRVFISLGKEGVFYKDQTGSGKVSPPRNIKAISTTGAGDAMSAAIVRSTVLGRDMDRIASEAVLAASLTLQVQSAVNENIGDYFD
jgi:pseudouridine kinase